MNAWYVKGARLGAALLLGALLVACGREMTVSVAYEDAGNLDTGTPVFLGEVKVGEVAGLTTTGDLTEAELALDPDLATGLSAGSAALLTSRNDQPAIVLYNYRPRDEPLQDGGKLVALHSSLEYAAWQAGEALDSGTQSVEEMTQSVSEYFQSEEWQQKKEEMNRRLTSLKEDLGQRYEETRQAYQELLEDLESESQAARERARESYAELAQKLRQEIARLKEQGNEKLVEPLQRLLDDLSRAMEKRPEQEST